MQGGQAEVEPGSCRDRAESRGGGAGEAASIPGTGAWRGERCRQAFSYGMIGHIHGKKGFKSVLCSHRLGTVPTPSSQPGKPHDSWNRGSGTRMSPASVVGRNEPCFQVSASLMPPHTDEKQDPREFHCFRIMASRNELKDILRNI